MAALGPAFRRVMRSTDSLLLLELPKIKRETCQQMTRRAVLCAERFPDQRTRWDPLGGMCWVNSGEKLQRREDLEIPLRAGFEAFGLGIRESPASVLLRLVDYLPCVADFDPSCQTKGTPRHVLDSRRAGTRYPLGRPRVTAATDRR